MVDLGLFDLGCALAAIALIGWAVYTVLDGSAMATGSVVREALAEGLAPVRATSALGRGELAEITIRVAAVLAMVGAVVDAAPVLVVLGGVLWLGRPSIERAMTEEHELLALSGTFTADLVIGALVPLVLAQLLVGNVVVALVLVLVAVALSWPAGGAGAFRPG